MTISARGLSKQQTPESGQKPFMIYWHEKDTAQASSHHGPAEASPVAKDRPPCRRWFQVVITTKQPNPEAVTAPSSTARRGGQHTAVDETCTSPCTCRHTYLLSCPRALLTSVVRRTCSSCTVARSNYKLSSTRHQDSRGKKPKT